MDMIDTPNGQRLSCLLRAPFRAFLALAARVLQCLPRFLPRAVLQLAFRQHPELWDALEELVDGWVCYNALYMAHCELETVKGLEYHDDTIRRHCERLVFYHGRADDWCPVSYYDAIRERYMIAPHGKSKKKPNGKRVHVTTSNPEQQIQVHLCTDGLPHAFVLGGSHVMAEKVADWIRKSVSTL